MKDRSLHSSSVLAEAKLTRRWHTDAPVCSSSSSLLVPEIKHAPTPPFLEKWPDILALGCRSNDTADEQIASIRVTLFVNQ